MRKLPAILITIALAFPLLLAALTTIAISTWVLDQRLYRQVLEDSRLYEIPKTIDPGEFWHRPWTAELDPLPTEIPSAALAEIVTPDDMKSQALQLLEEAFAFVNGESFAFDPSLDLIPLKKALAGEGGKRFARTLAQTLPVCSAAGPLIIRQGALPACRPPNVSVAAAAAAIEAALPAVVRKIPDTFHASEGSFWAAGFHPWGGWQRFPTIRALVAADIVLLLLGCGFWLLAAYVAGVDTRQRLQWMGWTLLVPSILVFLMGLSATSRIVEDALRFGIDSAELRRIGFSPAFVTAVHDAVQAIVRRAATGFLATGAISAGIGLGALAWSRGVGANGSAHETPPAVRSRIFAS
jgi:hypothetical protein